MAFVSTRNPGGPTYSLAEALKLGPAPDGGLFLPARLEPLPASFFARLSGASQSSGSNQHSLHDIASAVLERLLGEDLAPAAIRRVVEDALDFELPLVQLADNLRVLELFHGPTLAFKDVGARFLARLLPLTAAPDQGEITILVATSGDTGGAVAQAFWGIPGTRVAVLYPRGKVSPRQERQFTTLGGNVRAFAVDGVFDDCQRLVKQAFADRPLAEGLGLTSANSINVGRLLPQAIYYFWAAAQLSPAERERPLLFCTPSGNFGNLCAGLLARRLGLQAKFLAATNVNDVVPEYLENGDYRPRPSKATLSNAMDVGDPNNFARILHLYGQDREALRADVEGQRVSDEETLETLKRFDRGSFDRGSYLGGQGYLADPHTAVGLCALEKALAKKADGTIGIVLATAHPAKFAEAVESTLGRQLPLPEALARHMDRQVLAEDLPNDYEALKKALLAWT